MAGKNKEREQKMFDLKAGYSEDKDSSEEQYVVRGRINVLKKGVVIKLKDKNREGTVIDWGNVIRLRNPVNGSCKKLLLPEAEFKRSDSIRVKTNEGTIEIWPAEAVELTTMSLSGGSCHGR